MWFPPYCYFPFGQKQLSVASFRRNARVTLRCCQQTGAECYRTSAKGQNTTSGSTGSEHLTSQVIGSTFLPSIGFWLRFPSNGKWLQIVLGLGYYGATCVSPSLMHLLLLLFAFVVLVTSVSTNPRDWLENVSKITILCGAGRKTLTQ